MRESVTAAARDSVTAAARESVTAAAQSGSFRKHYFISCSENSLMTVPMECRNM